MSLEITNHLDGSEEKIAAFIFSVSGIHLQEETVGDKYTLRLGTKEPIEVGFYKNRHPDVVDFRFSSYLRMLVEFSRFMNCVSDFEIWCFCQKIEQ